LDIEKAEPDASASVAALNRTGAKGTSDPADISVADLLGLVNDRARKYIPE